jgi:hypothetical protein
MKKVGITGVLLAAGLVVASGLFAQEIKFDGYVNSGLGVVYSTVEDMDPYIAAIATDSWNNAFRIHLNATYTSESGNAGASLRLRASNGQNFLSLPIAYGWFSAFDKILTVKGGIVDDGTWNTGGAYLNGDMGEGLGALAKITPITGLDIGLGAFVAETPLESQNNSMFFGAGGDYSRELDQAKYTFSLGYTLPEVVKFAASYRPKSEAGVVATAADPLASRLRAGVSLLAVPGLKAVLEAELDNLQDFSGLKVNEEDAWDRPVTGTITPFSASGKINIYETFQYDLGSLSVGLWAAQWISQAEDADLGLFVSPWVSYTLGSIVPRLDLGYGSAARNNFYTVNATSGAVTNSNWRRNNYIATYIDDFSVISIRPSVKFNIDANTFVEIGDLIDINNGPAGTWQAEDDAIIANVFYVDFKWSF